MTLKYRIIRVPHVGRAFTHGMARVVDFGGALNDYHADELVRMYDGLRARRLAAPSGVEAETDTVRASWDEVGQCIQNAMGAFEAEDSGEHLPAEQIG